MEPKKQGRGERIKRNRIDVRIEQGSYAVTISRESFERKRLRVDRSSV